MVMEKGDVAGFVRELANQFDLGSLVGHVEYIEPREAQYRQPDVDLNPLVKAALSAKGAARTYTHQADAIDATLSGQNIVVSTSTASGKSVCFQAPVLHTLLENPDARALYLFPTKALGHDQLAGMSEMLKGANIDLECATYDGDTPKSERARVRRNSRIIISNVDMMQVSMLPQHNVWRDFLRNLAFVVIDEAHYYRGVFGSHVAMIIRRLRRILRRMGANPQFILCSATIANAGEHAEKLVGVPFRVIDTDGSPSGGRAFILLDSASAEDNDGNKGINLQSAVVTAGLMRRGIRTLTFAQNRAGVERIVQYTEEMLTGRRAGRYRRPDLKGMIEPYRAGYLAENRREVESGLRTGKLLAVASTNAMELGIDVGSIDATVITGFPGTIASSWQQAGRSGRTGKQSLSLMLLRDNPVDAFYTRFPNAFFDAAHESAQISTNNENIIGLHLECAAWEQPLGRADFEMFGEADLRRTAKALTDAGRLVVADDGTRRLPQGASNPSFGVNIRSSDNERYTLLNAQDGHKMEEITRLYALRELYPGAIYAHRGETYRVVEFSEEGLEASLSFVDQRIYTQPEINTEVFILEESEPVYAGRVPIRSGRVRVTAQVTGYYERDLYARDDEGSYRPVEMPPLEFETTAVWFCGTNRGVESSDEPALHSVAHVGTAALAMLAMCDRRDLGAYAVPDHPQLGADTAFIYEEDIGGVGLIEFIRQHPDLFVERMVEIVTSCRCDAGCPSCIESSFCSDDVAPPSKELMLQFLR